MDRKRQYRDPFDDSPAFEDDYFEPQAAQFQNDGMSVEEVAVISTAISLKRIADTLAGMLTIFAAIKLED